MSNNPAYNLQQHLNSSINDFSRDVGHKLSLNKIRNSVSKALGYENFNDFQKKYKDGKNQIVDGLSNDFVTYQKKIIVSLEKSITSLAISTHKLEQDKARNFAIELKKADFLTEEIVNKIFSSTKGEIEISLSDRVYSFIYEVDDRRKSFYNDKSYYEYLASELSDTDVKAAKDYLINKLMSWDGNDVSDVTDYFLLLESLLKVSDGSEIGYIFSEPLNFLESDFHKELYQNNINNFADDYIVALDKNGEVITFIDSTDQYDSGIQERSLEYLAEAYDIELD